MHVCLQYILLLCFLLITEVVVTSIVTIFRERVRKMTIHNAIFVVLARRCELVSKVYRRQSAQIACISDDAKRLSEFGINVVGKARAN